MSTKHCEHGKIKYRCKECKGGGICEHDKHRRFCTECKGIRTCEHKKIKRYCVECKGAGICEHGKRKELCKLCGGSAFCSHGKLKSYCRECRGSAFCIHSKIKYRCKECDGSALCIHNRQKPHCKECGGSVFCEHNKQKNQCVECNGSGICIHGKDKYRCKDCGGVGICEHGKRKSYCKECDGSAFCIHSKDKAYCKECGGSALCKTPECNTIKNKKYNGYCLFCFIHLFPDKPNAFNYKTKERAVVDFLYSTFPDLTLITDKRIVDGCSRRRPDVFIDFGDHVICIEVDENMHSNYDCSCENKRLMEISKDIGHRPLVFLRFNPDSYINEANKRIYSPWGLDGRGFSIIKRTGEWEYRLNILQEQVKYWISHPSSKTVEIIQLFYDMNVTEDDGTAKGGAGV
jgi:hypothetical protein